MRPKGLLASSVSITCLLGGVAVAQPEDTTSSTTTTAPPPPPPPTQTTTTTSVSSSSADAPAPPSTDGENVGTAFGVGAMAMLTGPIGPALVYNMGRFHIEGMFAFADIGDANSFTIAGRAWLHLHNSPRASLSVGGGGGLQSFDSEPMVGMPSEKTQNLLLEGGAQIRFFATRNVAISASAGLGIIAGDGDAMAITGQLTGSFGITYFIF